MPWRLLLVAAGLLIAIYLWYWGRPTPAGREAAPPSAAGTPAAAPSIPAVPGATAGRGAPSPEDGFEGLKELHSPSGTVTADLRLMQAVLEAFRTSFPAEGNPTGSNPEITDALAGANRLGLVLIPRGHPAINADGELCDRWGTPYFFHSESRRRTTIRSAGPDRRLWTDDDVEHAP
jgi:hypothetical protein